MTRRRLIPLLVVVFATAGASARAAAPPPLDPVRFAFPGSLPAPFSAASAGLAQADRWLGDEPAGNPAAAPARGVLLAPQGLRVSRQDLSADNREFSEQFGYLDFAGGRLTVPVRGLSVSLYAWQPVLRLENSRFFTGRARSVGASAAVVNDGSTREFRSGLALSLGRGATRAGAAIEWSQRSDRYQVRESSGSPDAGLRDLSFDGSVLGGAAGLRWERSPAQRGGLVLGAALHWQGALDAKGTLTNTLLSGDTTIAVPAARAPTWEAGTSARVTLSPDAGVYASVGARAPEKWTSFGLESGTGSSWAVGIDFHDVETPWSARFGLGQDAQPGTPEPRAASVGLGLGWLSGETTFELGMAGKFQEERCCCLLRMI